MARVLISPRLPRVGGRDNGQNSRIRYVNQCRSQKRRTGFDHLLAFFFFFARFGPHVTILFLSLVLFTRAGPTKAVASVFVAGKRLSLRQSSAHLATTTSSSHEAAKYALFFPSYLSRRTY